jgi:hypothetical protein
MTNSWLRQTTQYEIATDLYSGPLDLLLDLIQKAELDITKLALAQVTDQFLAYIETHRDLEPVYLRIPGDCRQTGSDKVGSAFAKAACPRS